MSDEKQKFTGVRAKLAAHKKSHESSREHILPRSKIKTTIPNYMNHGSWMKAQRQANGDLPTAQAAFIAEVVRFEGEKLTLADLSLLVDAKDMLSLIGEIFGEEEDEVVDEMGNE